VLVRWFNLSLALAALLLLVSSVAGQGLPKDAAATLLPAQLADFRARDAVAATETPGVASDQTPGIVSWAARNYVSKEGRRFQVTVTTTVSDSAAYAKLTQERSTVQSAPSFRDDVGVGTASISYADGRRNWLEFFKGSVSVSLNDYDGETKDIQALMNLGRVLADTIDKGAGEIPVLVKHLPGWPGAPQRIQYAVADSTLKSWFNNQTLLDAVSFEGGAEAVVANYDAQRLVIVEFNTASLATDNNQRITAKLQELNAQGQAVPAAYRRVGNYAVFVFDAPSEQAANQLIDQVKYQKVVQWLGEDPFANERATREFTETTLGVFVSVVKASGLALVTCLAVGGFLGAVLFSFRRAQQRSHDAFSDTDAMLRLNLDDLTPERDPGRLLGPPA
jgi:Family of unknown function (DUF6599)